MLNNCFHYQFHHHFYHRWTESYWHHHHISSDLFLYEPDIKEPDKKLFPHDNKGHWLQMMTKAENFSNHLFHDADLTQLFLYWTGMFQTFAHLLYSIPALWRDLVVHHQNYFFNNWQYRGAKVWFLHEILISCPYLWLKDRKYAATSKQFIPWWNF